MWHLADTSLRMDAVMAVVAYFWLPLNFSTGPYITQCRVPFNAVSQQVFRNVHSQCNQWPRINHCHGTAWVACKCNTPSPNSTKGRHCITLYQISNVTVMASEKVHTVLQHNNSHHETSDNGSSHAYHCIKW